MAQRGISVQDIVYVYRYGYSYSCAGALHYTLRRADIPLEDIKTKWRLQGIVVLICQENNEVITVYRNPNALKSIHQKPRWSWRCRKRQYLQR